MLRPKNQNVCMEYTFQREHAQKPEAPYALLCKCLEDPQGSKYTPTRVPLGAVSDTYAVRL